LEIVSPPPPPPPPPMPGTAGAPKIPTYREQQQSQQQQQHGMAFNNNQGETNPMMEQQVSLDSRNKRYLSFYFRKTNIVTQNPTRNQQKYANLPSKLSSAMNKDKKPFTYTLGGVG